MDAVSNEKSEYFQFNDDNYADVFNAYWRKLYAIAYQRLKDSELAKDLVQEVFVYCWKQKDVIKVTTTVEAYLRSALKYQIIAHFRKLGIQDRAFSYLLTLRKKAIN